MKALHLAALAASSVLLCACQQGPEPTTEPNTLSSASAAEGWELLFDGTTTNGWRGFASEEMPAGWQVVDRALTRVDGGGDIMTVGQYESFELLLEWQISANGNSGIMYHVKEGLGAPYLSGPEMQVLDNGGHPDGQNPITSAGACYGLYVPSADVTRPVGEWNSVRLLVDGAHVEHWLNGTLLCEYELWSDDWNERVAGSKFSQWETFGKTKRGHISLQDHGDLVAYRNIMIREL